jgi:DNA polymerase V
MSTAIGLVDANNFYVSCERVFQPHLINRPVIVLSNNDGCIIARSNEAKELGIKMGTPLFKAEQLVDAYDVAVYSSNYVLYGDMSQRVMGALHEFTLDVEIYSIDEAFMAIDADDSRTFRSKGHEIREKVRKWTGIPVSIGIAQTKTLAKIASRFAKQCPAAQGVLDLTPMPEQTAALEETDVEDADRRWVRKRMTVVGARIVEELRGVRCLPIEQCPTQKKSITCSRSFGVLTDSIEDLREAVSVYVTRAAERLRRHQMAAGAVTVFIMTNCFSPEPQYSNSVTFDLAYSTDVTDELLEWALRGLDRIFREGYKYKKAGVMLSDLVPVEKQSKRLFGDSTYECSHRVMEAVDQINARHGRGTIRFGVARPDGRWKTRFLKRSSRYTTCLREVLHVK